MKNKFSITQKIFGASSILLIFAVAINIKPHEITDTQKVLNLIAARQVPFLENIGQYQPQMKFYSHLEKGGFFIDQQGKLIYDLGNNSIQENFTTLKEIVPRPEDPGTASINSFVGEKSEWKKQIPNYNTINLGEVFKGVNVKIKAFGNNVEKIFTVSAKANPEDIKINIDGIDKMSINNKGQLEIQKNSTMMAMSQPIAYQEIGGKKQYVEVAYKPLDTHSYGFKIGSYREDQPLVIDPIIAATYVGGANGNDNYPSKPAVAVSNEDKIFVVGATTATDFPLGQTTGAYTTPKANGDIFIAKYNSTLTTLEAFTYIGGTGQEGENAVDIAIDNANNIFVTGDTTSTDFPVSTNAYQPALAGNSDAFLVKLDSTLGNLIAATYIGGSNSDIPYGIAVDSNDFVYLGGQTFSPNFPTTTGSFQTTPVDAGSATGDGFIAALKVDNTGDGTALGGSTLLGGGQADMVNDIKVTTSATINNIFVTGLTNSTNSNINFPTTTGAFTSSSNDRNNAGDAFVSVLQLNKNTNIINLQASTFLGGSEYDMGSALSFDSSNNIYVTGTTYSTSTTVNFPTTSGAYGQNSLSLTPSSYASPITGDAFITKFNWSGTTILALSASTFLGGTNYDAGTGIVLDNSQNVYITGITGSTDFPITNNAFSIRNSGFNDGFASKFNSNLTSLSGSTYFGGNAAESNFNLAMDMNQNLVFVAGSGSRDLSTSSGAYQSTISNSSFQDGYLVKTTNDLTAAAVSTGGSGGGSGTTTPPPLTAMIGPRIFTNIPDNTSFSDSAPGDTKFNNTNGPDSTDTLIVSDMKNDANSGFEVQLSASGFQTSDRSQSIGLENMYIITTLPHLPGNILDAANGMEYVSSCIGTRNVRSPVSAESLMTLPGGYSVLNNYSSKGSTLGNGTTGKVVVIMSAPAAARRCSMLVNVSYALKIPSNAQPGTYNVTLTYTLL